MVRYMRTAEKRVDFGGHISGGIQAVISDLDGTLLNRHHTVSPYARAVILALVAQGIPFIIATGRHYGDAWIIKKHKIGIDAYFITANGATVADPSGKLIYEAEMAPEAVRGILDIRTAPAVFKNLYQGELWLMEEPDRVFDAYYEAGDFMYTLARFADRMQYVTNKVFFTALNPQDLVPVADRVRAEFGHLVEVTTSIPQCLEIMPKGVNKGVALERLLKQLNIDPAQTIGFGDGLNDLEMLQTVGQGYVMANADPELKRRLPEHPVIGSNADDAVARHIAEAFNIDVECVPDSA